MKPWALLLILGLGLVEPQSILFAADPSSIVSKPPVRASRDAVAALLARIARSEVLLTGSDLEILRTVLQELQVPVSSQILVFSRTSLQSGLIGPDTPRALYFSDSVYVGWVPHGLIEVIAIDPELGPVFYGFDPQDARDRSRTFVRERSCLRCHDGSLTGNHPGLFARSVFTTESGQPLLDHSPAALNPSLEFSQRWGGWYVTGYSGIPPHRGNAFSREIEGQLVVTASAERPSDLTSRLETTHYLAATSDAVALLVFEHQLAMHNCLSRAAHDYRLAVAEQPRATTATKGPPASPENVADQLHRLAEDVLDALLFRDAAPLPLGITGSAAYRQDFASRAQRTRAGLSLADFSLDGRLFSYRCSFLIYSEAFRALPAELKHAILSRLGRCLGTDTDPRYGYLEPEERRRIRDILSETHPDGKEIVGAISPPRTNE